MFAKYPCSPDTNFILNNEPVPWVDTYKYLGIHLDSKLSWRFHIRETLKKAEAARASLSYLLALKSRLSLRNKLLLYKAFIRPIITYGCMAYAGAPKSTLERLQVFQNQTLCRIVSATRYIHNDVIHRNLNIRPIFSEIKKLALIFLTGRLNIPNPVLHSTPDNNASNRCKRPLSVLARSDDFIPVSKRRQINFVP